MATTIHCNYAAVPMNRRKIMNAWVTKPAGARDEQRRARNSTFPGQPFEGSRTFRVRLIRPSRVNSVQNWPPSEIIDSARRPVKHSSANYPQKVARIDMGPRTASQLI